MPLVLIVSNVWLFILLIFLFTFSSCLKLFEFILLCDLRLCHVWKCTFLSLNDYEQWYFNSTNICFWSDRNIIIWNSFGELCWKMKTLYFFSGDFMFGRWKIIVRFFFSFNTECSHEWWGWNLLLREEYYVPYWSPDKEYFGVVVRTPWGLN